MSRIFRNESRIRSGNFQAKLVGHSGPITMMAGETKEVWAEFLNTGLEVWTEITRLGTSGPNDRLSFFHHSSWLSQHRIASVKKITRPGETVRFTFSITAPIIFKGEYKESFCLLHELLTWFTGKEAQFTLDINVLPKDSMLIESSNNVLPPKDGFLKQKILYLSCHQTLEHSELTLLSQLGFNVFPIGTYTKPNPVNTTRDDGNFFIDRELYEKFMFYSGKDFQPGMPIKLRPEFLDEFDIIVNCHWYENFIQNREAFRNRNLIWRTVGLSNQNVESMIIGLQRSHNIKIVRMGPAEPTIAGATAVIRSHIDPVYFSGWIGDEDYVLTVQKWTRLGETGRLANEYQAITQGLKRKLCGKENRGFDCMVDNPTGAELMSYRRRARAYLSLATQNAMGTYTFLEAMMTGMPVVSVGKKLANTPWFENPQWIENGVSGFVSDDPKELRHYLELLLKDYDLAKKLGKNARESIIKVFSPDVILQDWRNFFKQEYGIITR